MSVPLVLHPDAQAEFDESHDWFEQRCEGDGEKFSLAIKAALARIRSNPLMYGVVLDDIRKAVVPNYRFCIYYVVHDDHVFVTSVFHTSRDPAVWQGRR